MSLRLSSLNPDDPRAPKDCRVCNRRRIRCDRSLPFCRKCALRNLECPGYSLRLQWDQGIASRGKLRGKAHPTGDNDEDPGQEPSSLPIPRVLHSVTVLRTSGEQNSEQLSDPGSLQLLEYYEDHVAAWMPWFDNEDNPWRVLIPPLARECASLLHAILALAAEHRGHNQTQTSHAETQELVSYHRSRSLQLLAQDLRTELEQDDTAHEERDKSGLLATILVLCNVEMIRFDPKLWHIHFKAARTIVERWTTPAIEPIELDDRRSFILTTVFAYDVFAASTKFDEYDAIPSSVVQFASSELFISYLVTVQELTRAERQLFRDQISSSNLGLEQMQSNFDLARRTSKAAVSGMITASVSLTKGLESLIDVFHYAGLLYGLQIISDITDTEGLRQQYVNNFVSSLSEVEVRGPLAHNLVWPLFIAGAEARQLPQLQGLVQSLMPSIMQSTGFSNCEVALDFLQRFWTTDPHVVVNWLAFARQDDQQDLMYIVI